MHTQRRLIRTHAMTHLVRVAPVVAARVAAFVGIAPAHAAGFAAPALPHSIIAFPQRDFLSATGYAAGVAVHAELWRNGVLISRSTDILPQDDPKTPEFDGLVEVNHPGGGCWLTVTPDMRPGDVLAIVTPTVTEGTVAAKVTAGPAVQTGPTAVVVHGTAQDALGNPLPISQIEQRLVLSKDLFDLNGRRTLRASAAGIDSTLAYDAPGSINWTVTYTGLDALDIARALGAQSRMLWLASNPLLRNTSTISQ